MDAYAAEKKGLEALKKLEANQKDQAELIVALQAEIAKLKAEAQPKNSDELDSNEEESKEESKVE